MPTSTALRSPPKQQSLATNRGVLITRPARREDRPKRIQIEVEESGIEVSDAPPGSTVPSEAGAVMPSREWMRAETLRQKNFIIAHEWEEYIVEFEGSHDMARSGVEMQQNQAACFGAAVRAANRMALKNLKKLSHADKPRFRRMTRTR